MNERDQKKTLVLGASANPARYANMATQRLLAYGHEVELLGRHPVTVADRPVKTDPLEIDRDIHTVTVYLSVANQKAYEDFILDLKPQRVIFNPGAENPILEQKLRAAGIESVEACTLVMLSTSQF